jgi:hypothetical protein
MKGGIRFYFAGAMVLLTLAGCAHGTSVAVREEGSATAADPNDDLSFREQRFGEVDFGPGDPGITVITADKGGNINWYESKFFGAENENARWVVDGYCNSACTMVLGTGRVCATPRAQFGFHAGYNEFFGFWKVIKPQPTYQMYRRYPDEVKNWVDSRHAMDQLTMTMMRQPEVAIYVPSCRRSAAGWRQFCDFLEIRCEVDVHGRPPNAGLRHRHFERLLRIA